MAQYRDECFTFTRREFTDDAHGGGNQHGIDINVEELAEFRSCHSKHLCLKQFQLLYTAGASLACDNT